MREAIGALPPSRWDEKLPAGWTLKEMVGHLAYWESTIPAFVDSLRAGTSRDCGDVDAQNANAAAEARGLSREEVLLRWDDAHSEMLEVARNLTDAVDGVLKGMRYLIHDRDPLFTIEFRDSLRGAGVTCIKLPARSPDLNAYAERFVLSIKSECLAKMVPLGERHLRRAVIEFVEHYHVERNHQGLENQLITKPATPANNNSPVVRRERLGGILNFYYRRAS